MSQCLASLVILLSAGIAAAGPLELYTVAGKLLSTADEKFAVRSGNEYSALGPIDVAVTVRNIATGDSLLTVTPHEAISVVPSAELDSDTVSYLQSGFGRSAAIAGNRLLVGAPGSEWVCDCTIDPGIEVRGRRGRAFVFDLEHGRPPTQLKAPSLSTLLQSQPGQSGENWVYFGSRVAATDSVGLVNGSVFNLSTGELLKILGPSDPWFDAPSLTSSAAVISRNWGNEISILNLAGNGSRSIAVPQNASRTAYPIALDGNLALVGMPGAHYDPAAPGSAVLFNLDSGQALMHFDTDGLGVVAPSGGDAFGRSVAIRGNYALIGAPHDSKLGVRSGAAYLFDIRTGGLLDKILPESREYPSHFGEMVGLSDANFLVGDLSVTSVYSFVPEPCTGTLACFSCVLLSQFRRTRKTRFNG